MLYQPTNITPSMTGGLGNGCVDATKALRVSWQVNGNSAMTAFQIVVYRNNAASTQLYTTGKLTQGCPFYGVDYAGNVQFFAYTIPASALSGAGITNGGEYKLVITQWWSASESVTQTSASAFITRATPVLSIASLPATVAVRSYTFTASYTQTQGDSLNWARWQFALVNGDEYETLRDTGRIYGTGELRFSYDGLFSGSRYAVRCSVQTQNGVEADTGWAEFNVQYAMEPIPGELNATADAAACGIRLTFPPIRSIPADIEGAYSTADSYLHLADGAKAVWDTQDGEDMALSADADVVWRGKQDANGTVLKVSGDGLTVNISNIQMTAPGADVLGGDAVAYGNGVYVLAGSKGQLMWSTDLSSWTVVQADIPATMSWKTVIFGGGKFVALSYTPSSQDATRYAAVSADGKSWQVADVPASGAVNAAAYGNGTYVAVGASDVLYSADGLQWYSVSSEMIASATSIIFDGTRFVAAGRSGVYESKNGAVWGRLYSAALTTPTLVYGGGVYCLFQFMSAAYWSQDCVNWTALDVPVDAYSWEGSYGGGAFLCTGYRNDSGLFAMVSKDGKQWSTTEAGRAAAAQSCYDGVKFVIPPTAGGGMKTAVVQDGTAEFEAQVQTVTEPASTLSWSRYGMPAVQNYATIAYGNGLTVATIKGSNSVLLSSDNGVAWSVNFASVLLSFKAMAYSSTLNLFVGLQADGYCYYSTDGKSWTQGTTMPRAYFTSGWADICWADGFSRFYAVGPLNANGEAVLAYSSDGKTWSLCPTASGLGQGKTLESIAYGKDGLKAIDRGGYVFNATTATGGWTSVTLIGDDNTTQNARIAYGNGVYVAFVNGKLMYRDTGNWKSSNLFSSTYRGTALCFGGGKFFISFYNANDPYRVYAAVSADGNAWTSASRTNLPLNPSANRTACYAGDRFIMLGSGNTSSVSNSFYDCAMFTTTLTPITTSRLPATVTFYDVCFGAGKYIAICDQATFYSIPADFSASAAFKGGFAEIEKHAICYGEKGFACLGGSIGSFVMRSTQDGETWSQGAALQTSGVMSWDSIAYGNGVYVAVGTMTGWTYGISARSTDLSSWTYSQSGLQTSYSEGQSARIAFANGVFVASLRNDKRGVFYSTDGASWTHVDLSAYVDEYSYISSVQAANGKFFITRNFSPAQLLYSTDGRNWTYSASTIPFMVGANGIAGGDGVYVAVGNGKFAWSTDASTWQYGDLRDTAVGSACYGGGKFFAVGNAIYANFSSQTTVTSRYLRFLANGSAAVSAPLGTSGNMTIIANGSTVWWNADSSGVAELQAVFTNIRALELDGKQSCDYLMVSDGHLSQSARERILSDMAYHPNDQRAQFYADFDGSTNGGGVSGTQFTSFALYRYSPGDAALTHIVDVDGSAGNVVVDAGVVNGKKYRYYAFGAGGGTFVTSALTSQEVCLYSWDWTLLSCTQDESGVYHVEQIFRFGKNLTSGGVSNNNAPQILQNFTRYPTVQTAPQLYRSGTLQSLIGTIRDSAYSDSITLRDAIWALSATKNTLFLKDRKGDILRVQTSGAVEMQTQDNSVLQPQTVTLPWVEVGGMEDARIVIMQGDGAWPYGTEG